MFSIFPFFTNVSSTILLLSVGNNIFSTPSCGKAEDDIFKDIEVAQLSPTENLLGWTWKPPKDVKFSVLEYKTDDDNPAKEEIFTEKTNRLKLKQLTPGKEYTITFRSFCGKESEEDNDPLCLCATSISTMKTLPKGIADYIIHE